MTPTQGEHAKTALAHELFAAAQLAPGEGIEDAVSRIAAALTAAPEQLLSPTEQKWVLQSPAAIAQLLTFIDLDHSQAVSVLGAEEWEPWPPKRYTELKEIGRKVVEQDPECFDADILREFGFAAPAQPAAPQGVAYAMHQRVEELIEKESELRRVVEIIALGESANPVIDAGDELVALGYWDAGAVAALRASNGQAPAGARSSEVQIAEALRAKGLTLVKTGTGYEVLGLGEVMAQAAPAAGAVAWPNDLITIRKPTTRQEVEWLAKLAHLLIGDVNQTLDDLLAAAPTQAQAGFKSGAKSFQTYAEANAYSKGYYAGKKAATKAQAGAVPLTVDEVEQLIAQWSYEVHGDRARYLVRMTEQHHGIKGADHA